MSTQLIRYDAMCAAIEAAHRVDEVKEIRDRALALETYARQAVNTDAERKACEIRLRAERKAGKLLRETIKAKGAPGNQYTGKLDHSAGASGPKTLADDGISHDQSSKWQQLADVPEDMFERALAELEKPSTKAILRATTEPKPNVVPVSDDAALFLSNLGEYERHGWLARDPASVMDTMTPEMLDRAHVLAPRVAAWLRRIGALNGQTEGS